MGRPRLSRWEQTSTGWVRRTIDDPRLDRACTLLQEHVGAWWIDRSTAKLRHVVGIEHARPFAERSVLLVANHRSFFDMFVINAVLYRQAGFRQRILFPVRSSFFYDQPLGLLVNGIMSFFSMYPPVYRDPRRAVLNHASFRELAELMRRGVRSAGLHPEGTRNRSDDPYAFLPVQSGAGRLIHLSEVPVLPVFVNGLENHLVRQVWGNFQGTGRPIIVVFGPPVELDDLLGQPARGRTYQRIAERAMEAVARLGEVERAHRAHLEGPREARAEAR